MSVNDENTSSDGRASQEATDPNGSVGCDSLTKKNIEKTELESINSGRKEEKLSDVNGLDTFALAFSGGGIRSATLCLGVIQALAERRLLRKFDYLSTVSGGGYIGSWLTSRLTQGKAKDDNLRTMHVSDLEEELAVRDSTGKVRLRAGTDEPDSIRHLRSYSSYLTPHSGLFSLDTLTAVVTWCRNVLLNMLILVAFVAVILLIPKIIALSGPHTSSFFAPLNELSKDFGGNQWVFSWLLFAVAIRYINVNLWAVPPNAPYYASASGIIVYIVLPLTLGALILANVLPDMKWNWTQWQMYVCPVLLPALLYLPEFLFRMQQLQKTKPNDRGPSRILIAGWNIIGFVAATLVGVLLLTLSKTLLSGPSLPEPYEVELIAVRHWYTLFVGVPCILLIFSVSLALHVGIVGRIFEECDREWWSRFAAIISSVILIWIVLFGLSFWGAILVEWIEHGVLAAISWIATSAAGVIAGRSAQTGGDAKPSFLARASVAIAPPVFVAGLLLLVAFGLDKTLLFLINSSYKCPITSIESGYICAMKAFSIQTEKGVWIVCAAAILAVFVWLFAARVDVNLFSFHSFYRNRLARCYMRPGRSRDERSMTQYQFTEFDPKNAPLLQDVQSRPYHLICTALNITTSRHLSWQERKAASFIFSREYCGYWLPDYDAENKTIGSPDRGRVTPKHRAYYYQRTKEQKDARGEGIRLDLPIAISGAAANPNAGYHSDPAMAFLLTIFNARLGWWMQNTNSKRNWKRKFIPFGLSYLLMDLTGSADEATRFVSLSDGGHFENLGIYELVRRRCRLIVSIDGGADSKYVFDDLANAVRKCYIDFGVEIDIDVSNIRPEKEASGSRSESNYAVGVLRYSRIDPQLKDGYLIYIKSSILSKEDIDIEHYKAEHSDFPHESTADQFFSESQFESYRKLGYRIGGRTFDDIRGKVLRDVHPKAFSGDTDTVRLEAEFNRAKLDLFESETTTQPSA